MENWRRSRSRRRCSMICRRNVFLFILITILFNAVVLLFYTQSETLLSFYQIDDVSIDKKIHFEDNEILRQYGHDFIERLLENNNHRCPNSRRPELPNFISSVWQTHKYPGGIIYLYSVFYDDRPAAEFLVSLRLIVLATFDSRRSVDCHVWYEHMSNEPYVIKAIFNETGMHRYQFNEHGYREYIFTCPLPTAYPIPTHVSIAMTGKCSNYSTYLPVHRSDTGRASPMPFGVCVANGFGATPTDEFVEWMELLLLYGVSEVNLYDTNFVNMTKEFDYYVRSGVLKVRKVPHPLPWDKRWYDKVRNLRSVSLNDCMLRNMYRYQYIIVIDLDEMIVPRSHNNYSAMLRDIDQHFNLSVHSHSYSFRNTYFLKDFSDDKPSTILRTMYYRQRAKPSGMYYGSKSFVSPLCCFNLFNHYCYTLLPKYRLVGKVTVFSPADIATSHHYRKCGKFTGSSCDQLFKEKIQDDVMLGIKPRLLERVEPVLRRIEASI